MKLPISLSGISAIILFSTIPAASAISCTACKALLTTLRAAADISNGAFVTVIQDYCVLAGLQDKDVCDGVTNEVGPIIAHSLRQLRIDGWSGTLLCTTVFGTCDIPAVNAHTVAMPTPARTVTRPTSTGGTPLKVVHLTDVHIDRSYTVGSYTKCTKNICCRKYPDSPTSFVAADAAGEYGNVKCDSPATLAQSMLNAVKELASDASFSIFTGDVVEGAVWEVTNAEVTSDIQQWQAQFATASLGSKVYQAVGNHDMAPVNSFPRSSTTTTTYDPSYIYALDSDWKSNYGCYTSDVPNTKLTIITLNTQYWYRENFWLYDSADNIADPNGILAWLVTQLQTIETAGRRAWIIGHMPPGKPDALRDQSNYLDQIVRRYNQTVAAQFYGHSHKDEFEVGYSDNSNKNQFTASSIAFVAPALTPTSGNPSFRVYDVDPDTYEIMDYSEMYTDIASSTYQSGPVWGTLYKARETYAPLVDANYPATASLDASFWHRLTSVFESNDAIFQGWYNRRDRGYSGATCDATCKTSQLCLLRAQRSEDNCYVPTGSFSFSKRDGATPAPVHTEDECEDGRMKGLLQMMASGFIGESGLPNVTEAVTASVAKHKRQAKLD